MVPDACPSSSAGSIEPMDDQAKYVMFADEDDGVTLVPFKPGLTPLKESVPIRLNVPVPGELLEEQILDSGGRPITA